MRIPCTLLAFILFACGQPQRALEPESAGTAVLKFRMALPAGVAAEEVREARLTVSASDMDTLAFPLAVAGAELVGVAEAVPAGTGRTLEIQAEDAQGRRIVSGRLRTDVEAGEAAVVAVILQRVGTVRLDATFDTSLPD